MGQNVSRRYATDDAELKKLLDSVMGNRPAARVFWSCLMSDDCQPIEFLNTARPNSCDVHEDVGALIHASLTERLDSFCIDQGISRFSAILNSVAVLIERYSGNSDFWIHHNYGVTNSKDRILKYPVTRIDLGNDEASISFRDLCLFQDELIQKSSYHLCIPNLPEMDGVSIDHFMGVFLLDPKSGHSMDSITDGIVKSTLAVVIELIGEKDIILRLYYRTSYCSSSIATSILNQILFTLSECLAHPDLDDLRHIVTVPPDQRPELLDQSVFALPHDGSIKFDELEHTLDELVFQQATNTPEVVALRQFLPTPSELTYGGLIREAQRMSREIRGRFKIRGNSRIGVLLNRGMSQIISVLAIHLSGCAYVPMDPVNHPPERIEYILRDSEAVGLITESLIPVAKSFQSKVPCIIFDLLERPEFDHKEEIIAQHRSADDVAYVIYTSGSTGNPKGVLVPHRGIVNDIHCVFKQYMQSDRSIIENVLFSTNLCFDAHVDELFLPLAFGGSITCLESNIAQTILDPKWNLTFVQSTPSVFQVIDVPDSVKCVLIGGEALNKATIQRVMRPGRLVLNGYGPTETTNESSMHVVRDLDDFKSIGKPIWNTQFYILDKSGLNLVPKHAWGELYIGGVGVTKGYCNLPEQTKAVFLENHPMFPNQRIYKTGDIVRINADGDLEFKGRKQSCGQIKLRGYRIELGEIQFALLVNNPHIKEAHVCVSHMGGSDQIVAYIAPDTTAVDSLVYGQLPEYMKPSVVIPVKSFPRNISGKLDLKALPRPAFHQSNKLFASDSEAKVTQAFINAIGLDAETCPLNNETNFFSIGGNSLNAITLRSRLVDAFNVSSDAIKLQLLFQLQTVGNITAYIDEIRGFSKHPKREHDHILVPLGASRKCAGMPLFCVHAAGGQVHTYSTLAEAFKNNSEHDVRFFGIQDPSLSLGPIHRLSSFEALGALYAKRIHEFYPKGPVFIGGHSSGGNIAFETARCLESEFRREIGCVFLIDTDCCDEDAKTRTLAEGPLSLIERLDEIRYYVFHGWKEGLAQDYINAITTVSESNGGKTWRLLRALLPSRRSDGSSTATRWSSDLFDMVSLLSHHLQIEKKYSPFKGSETVHFPIVLFRPALEEDEPAWRRLTSNKCVVVNVPDGNHYNLVRRPAVDLISTVITDFISQRLLVTAPRSG